jgi:recombination associated protein RdgC
MNLAERLKKTEFLGREFLVWLWFRSEIQDGVFELGEPGEVELWLEGKMTLESDGDEHGEKVVCSGPASRMKEARFALTKNKKLTQATVRMLKGDDEWCLVLDSTWLNISSLKTPRVMQDVREDPDGLFYERMFLIEQPFSVVDALFSQFIEKRLSPEWNVTEFPELKEWILKGK